MKGCLNADTLTTLGNLLDRQPQDAIRHLTQCERCQLQLRQLARLHCVLDDEIQPADGFVDRVVESLAAMDRARWVATPRVGAIGVVNAVLAGITSFFVIGLGLGGRSPELIGLPVLLVSLMAGASALWWKWVHGSDSVYETHRGG